MLSALLMAAGTIVSASGVLWLAVDGFSSKERASRAELEIARLKSKIQELTVENTNCWESIGKLRQELDATRSHRDAKGKFTRRDV